MATKGQYWFATFSEWLPTASWQLLMSSQDFDSALHVQLFTNYTWCVIKHEKPSALSHRFLCPLSFLLSVQEGQQLIQEKPELSPVVRRKLEEIRECWQDLESTTQAKARQLFEANKADLLVQSYESLDQRLGQLEGQLAYVDQGQDLTTVNKQLKKLQVCVFI